MNSAASLRQHIGKAQLPKPSGLATKHYLRTVVSLVSPISQIGTTPYHTRTLSLPLYRASGAALIKPRTFGINIQQPQHQLRMVCSNDNPRRHRSRILSTFSSCNRHCCVASGQPSCMHARFFCGGVNGCLLDISFATVSATNDTSCMF
jgi:hypothetical protein